MKATGIVRRIEEGGIITPRAIKPYKYGVFRRFLKKFLPRNSTFGPIHSKSEVNFTSLFSLHYVASATYSNIYQTYSDQARKASHWWYAATLISLVCLIVLSICWFVIKEYNNTDYVLLIARICASVGFAVVSRYSAIQASKNKVMETKLRKIQLQMATFDAFVASLDKEEQDKLKIELTHKLIEQEDWLVHDKNEIDTIKDVVKLLEKSGYKVDLKKPE